MEPTTDAVQRQIDNTRQLAAQEILSNLQHLDSRLLFVAHALELNETDEFSLRFDSIFGQWAPAIDSDPGSSLRKLITRTNISSLRQALNSVPLRQNFGQALVQAFVQSNIQSESQAVILYLDQFEEVSWAEQSLFDAMEAYANEVTTQDTCPARRDRVAIGWATIRNRAALYHLYALRLLHALSVDISNSPITLSSLRVLSPKKPLSQTAFEALLLPRTVEMAAIMKKRTEVVRSLQTCRDKPLADPVPPVGPADTWQEVIIKARTFRELGRVSASVEAFRLYGQMFGATDTTALPYSKTAIRFTEQMSSLSVAGGVYLYGFTEESHIRKAGLRTGDILVSLQKEIITGMDNVYAIFLKTADHTPLSLEIMRWKETAGTFRRLTFVIPAKPMGGMFIPI